MPLVYFYFLRVIYFSKRHKTDLQSVKFRGRLPCVEILYTVTSYGISVNLPLCLQWSFNITYKFVEECVQTISVFSNQHTSIYCVMSKSKGIPQKLLL